MSTELDSLVCKSCGRIISLPANFCDLCGRDLHKSKISRTIKSFIGKIDTEPLMIFLGEKKNQELFVRISVPVVMLVIGLYMYFSSKPELKEWLFFLFPIMVGTAVGYANIKEVSNAMDRGNQLILKKIDAVKDKGGKFHEYGLKPLLWLLNEINILSSNITKLELRNGFKIAAYLYICLLLFFLAYITVVIVVGIIILIIIGWLIDTFSEDYKVSESRRAIYSKSIKKEKDLLEGLFCDNDMEKLKKKFGSEFGRLASNGVIYSKDLFPVKIGYIDENGNIYDTREFFGKKIGRVNEEGSGE